MSRAIFDAPMIRPDPSLTADSVIDTSRRDPSLRPRPVSKCSTRSPARRRASIRLFPTELGRNHHRHRLSHGLLRRVTVHTLGAAIPGGDDPLGIEPEDRVLARLDDGREPAGDQIGVPERLLLRLQPGGRRALDAPCAHEPIVQPGDHDADGEKPQQRAELRPAAVGEPLGRHHPAGGRRRKHRRQPPRPEAAVGRRGDHRDKEGEKWQRLRHPRMQDQARGAGGDDGGRGEQIGMRASASLHRIKVSELRREVT